MENLENHEPIAILSSKDDSYIYVKRMFYLDNTFRIYSFDSLTKTSHDLADYSDGKYRIHNEVLFNRIFVKELRHNKNAFNKFKRFITSDFTNSPLKEFTIRLNCFKRRVNIKIHKIINKTKQWG